jgi:hypothetical protein
VICVNNAHVMATYIGTVSRVLLLYYNRDIALIVIVCTETRHCCVYNETL